ncbi:hypothetical protein NAP1_05685 [Erythrobacter sp. NAP1]|nr:hypothetical protein NAP1_05685 [Erythrobacter sp. NAP1]
MFTDDLQRDLIISGLTECKVWSARSPTGREIKKTLRLHPEWLFAEASSGLAERLFYRALVLQFIVATAPRIAQAEHWNFQ